MTLRAQVDLDRVPATFGGSATSWLGERGPDGPNGMRRFHCDLELRVSPTARSLFKKAAVVGIGEPQRDGDAAVVPIEWFAATFAPLFPVFAGELRLTSSRIELHGAYVPPGGWVGYALDRSVLRIAARATARWFLQKVSTAVA